MSTTDWSWYFAYFLLSESVFFLSVAIKVIQKKNIIMVKLSQGNIIVAISIYI